MKPEKNGTNKRLKNMSDFRELHSMKSMHSVIWISSFEQISKFLRLKNVLIITEL